MINIRNLCLSVALFGMLLVSCDANPTVPTASITMTSTSAEAVAVSARLMQIIETPTVTPDDSLCPPSVSELTQHTVVVDIDYIERVIDVQQRIRYPNMTESDMTQIVVNIDPNRWQNVLTLNQVLVDETPASYEQRGPRLAVQLPDGVPPGCDVQLRLDYRLDVPLIGFNVNPAKGYFGYTERQMNLGHWLATVAPRQGDFWITRDPFLVGEQDVLDSANWNVTVNFLSAPENLTVAAPGEVMTISANSSRYTLNNAREFPMSLSDRFVVTTQDLDSGVTVELYSFSDNPIAAAAPQALDTAVQSLATFTEAFGPMPYDRLLIIQGDFPDGMELSGLVFVGNSWFTRYPNNPASYLTLITAHEVAHQWWYAQVGNDAALTPWLDEALATYSEYIFLEQHYPDLAANWWWDFRVNAFGPIGFVDSNVYEFSSVREYINAVYLRGVRMLHDLRADLGDEAFFALLRDYAEVGDGQIATPALFWSLLTSEQLELTAATRAAYLRQPHVEQFEGASP